MSEKPGALLTLARKMSSFGPPALSVIIARISELEDYDEFIRIVKEFLPERESIIFNELTPAAQVATFASYFADRYFPLDSMFESSDVEGYGDVARGVPVIVKALDYEGYHEIASDFRLGAQLMSYLVESPYDDGDARVALAEACGEHVSADLLQKVPKDGFSRNELHQLIDNTPHAALAIWADVLNLDTGNVFLDTDYEMLCNGNLPDWDREVIDALTNQWPQAERIEQETCQMMDWLEDKPADRFSELVEFILKRKERHDANKRSKRLSMGAAGDLRGTQG